MCELTKEQLKHIIEHDHQAPPGTLSAAYEESVRRETYKHFVIGCILKYFRTTERAERLTKMTTDELKWLCYEKGFEALKVYKPGNRPFIALWSVYIKRGLRDAHRTHQAQKRTAELVEYEGVRDWVLPSPDHTEKTVLDRLHIQEIFNQLRDHEKEIVLKRYEGFTMHEIAEMQGVTKPGMQKRIHLITKRLREVYSK